MAMIKSNVNPRGGKISIPVAIIRMSPNLTVHSLSEIKVSRCLMYAPVARNLKI